VNYWQRIMDKYFACFKLHLMSERFYAILSKCCIFGRKKNTRRTTQSVRKQICGTYEQQRKDLSMYFRLQAGRRWTICMHNKAQDAVLSLELHVMLTLLKIRRWMAEVKTLTRRNSFPAKNMPRISTISVLYWYLVSFQACYHSYPIV